MRPITYINYYIDPAWTPLIATPPFPEYSSGHSSQSGAASEVLTAIYGANYSFTDYSKVPDGFAPRSFNSFYAFADEAAVSRLYGGIHFRAANENGVICGRKVGSNIMKIVYKK
ncbi:MAG: vanadium-dependent haloperoxidase [Bacteroidetes bacterium]|nr:vanadium-dependent haloperoxidase [Bacteroidota bacterium]